MPVPSVDPDRLSFLDASFLYLERPNGLLHVGAVCLLDGAIPVDDFVEAIGRRLGAIRRYRQRPVRSPLDLQVPAWEDVPAFDPRTHVRGITVPPPGGPPELHALVDHLFSLPFDRARPLWEVYLIEGLRNGRAAVLTKVHHCMIDGVSGAQTLELMMDGGQAQQTGQAEQAAPAPHAPPSRDGERGRGLPIVALGRETVAAAGRMLTLAIQPTLAFARVREAVGTAGLVVAIARAPLRPMPFNGELSPVRRVLWAAFDLDDFLALRGAAACKVNDVVLAVIAGALRRYLPPGTVAGYAATVRALIPVNVRRPEEHLTLGNRVSAMIADLPIGVADPVDRLRLIARQMRVLKASGQRQAFELVVDVAESLPAPLGAAVARLGTLRPLVHTVCTNVPGGRDPRSLLGRRVLEVHPIVPLALGIGLGFAVLSYAGTLSVSVTVDPKLVPDAERLRDALLASAGELRARLGVPHRPDGDVGAGPRVADLMSRDVLTVAPHETLDRPWEVMRVHRIRHLPVVDGSGRLVGLVTHRDLLAAAQSSLSFVTEAERVRLLRLAQVTDIMETHLSTAAPDEAAAAVGRRMARHKIGCLPVLDGAGALVGIVTEEDFLVWATEQMATA